jgi:hypothetical protein
MSKATALRRPVKPRWSGKFRAQLDSHSAITGRRISASLVILARALTATALAGLLLMKASCQLNLFRNAAFYERETIMPHWRKTVMDSPETDQAAYVTGWTISSH